MHPFDSRKYGRAWRVLKDRLGPKLKQSWIRPAHAMTREQLLEVHGRAYLDSMGESRTMAKVLELPLLRRAPAWLIRSAILKPMLWATQGTFLAAASAVNEGGVVVNLGGGFHHAKPNSGEGFCAFADVGLAIQLLRNAGTLNAQARVAHIDLDAHQGNGVAHVFAQDPSAFLFDMYNAEIYPFDPQATERIDCPIRLSCGTEDEEYLNLLKDRLPPFLDSIGKSEPVEIAIYNAGTDVFAEDPLGMLGVSAGGILERDLFVVQELQRRSIPVVMLLSGGYTRQSYQLVATTATRLLQATA